MSSTVTASARQYTAASSEFHSIADNASLSYSGDFSFAAWVYIDSKGVNRIIAGKQDPDGNTSEWFARFDNTADKFDFFVSHNGTTATNVNPVASTFGSPSLATWYFYVATWTASTGVGSISINDGAVNTATNAAVVPINTTARFTISGLNNPIAVPWNGRIGPTGFWKKVLSAAEITSIYNAGSGKLYKDLTTGEKTNLISWWDGAETSGVRIDAHSTNHLTDNNTVTSAAGKVTYTAEDASQFTAANTEYLSITDASQSGLDIGNADKYFCAWVYLDNLGTLRQIVSKWLVNATTQQSYTFYISASNQLVWIVSKDGTTANNVSCTASEVVVASRWYFCEVWHNATSDLIGASLNRGTEATAAITTGVNDGTRDFTISMFSPDYPFNGRISSVVVTNGIPTATERDALYNRGFGVDYSDKPALSVATYVSWWELTEASGSRADSHGSNTLTDNNTVTGNPGVVYDAPAVITFKPSIMLLGVG